MCVCIIKPECLRRLERQLVYIVGTAKSKRRRRALNTAALNTAQHTGPQHSEDRHRTQLNTAALNSEDRHRTQRLSAQLNTAALNSEDRHRPLHTPQRSEDRHRPLHTQAAALKLDLNDFNMSIGDITSTYGDTLSACVELC